MHRLCNLSPPISCVRPCKIQARAWLLHLAIIYSRRISVRFLLETGASPEGRVRSEWVVRRTSPVMFAHPPTRPLPLPPARAPQPLLSSETIRERSTGSGSCRREPG